MRTDLSGPAVGDGRPMKVAAGGGGGNLVSQPILRLYQPKVCAILILVQN